MDKPFGNILFWTMAYRNHRDFNGRRFCVLLVGATTISAACSSAPSEPKLAAVGGAESTEAYATGGSFAGPISGRAEGGASFLMTLRSAPSAGQTSSLGGRGAIPSSQVGGKAPVATSSSGGAPIQGGSLSKTALGGSAAQSLGGSGTGGCLDGPALVAPTGYRLVWSDEFNVEGRPDPANWSYETGFVRNEEAQWYQAENASVSKGCLVIEGRRERVENKKYQKDSSDWRLNRQYAEYTSSSLHSRDKQSFMYGRFEMRGRIKTQTGLWPAFWTLGNAGEWPSSGEIDIMEYYAGSIRANVACGTAKRWEAKWAGVGLKISSFEDKAWQEKFHLWRMDWDSESINLFLDDKLVNSVKLSSMLNADGSSPFKQPHYMLLNLAIGGNNGGDPTQTEFPSRVEFDYVRVFAKQ